MTKTLLKIIAKLFIFLVFTQTAISQSPPYTQEHTCEQNSILPIADYSFEHDNEGWELEKNANRISTPHATNGNFGIELTKKQRNSMVSPLYDFSNYTIVKFDFDYTADFGDPNDSLRPGINAHIIVDISVDGGNTWEWLRTYTHPGKDNINTYNIEIENHIIKKYRVDNVRFRIRRKSLTNQGNFFAVIDNISISGKKRREAHSEFSFENGKQGWSLPGKNSKRVRSANATDGNVAVRLKKNNGRMISPVLDLSDHNHLRFLFDYTTKGKYTHKRSHIHIERSTNYGPWIRLTSWSHKGTAGINRYNREVRLCGDWLKEKNVRFRIRVSLGHVKSQKYIDVDNIRIRGTVISQNGVKVEDTTTTSRVNNTDTQYVAFENPKNILDKNTLDNVILYPNPSSNYIKIENLKANSKFTIYDYYGNSILKGVINPNEHIDISNLINGIYIINVENDGEIKQLNLIKN